MTNMHPPGQRGEEFGSEQRVLHLATVSKKGAVHITNQTISNMLRFIVSIWARWTYILRKEHEWSARVAERNAKMTREMIAELTKEADEIQDRYEKK